MLTPLLASIAVCTLNGASANLEFRNTSWRRIPLTIPSVMNPNLYPKSTSYVTLRDGQEVFFTYRGERTLLLTICNQRDGDVITVNELIARRTAELDAARK